MRRIGILGGGPSGLFVFKRLIESGEKDFHIEIFERKKQLGSGMPYSNEGATDEHVTNVSGNEIPGLGSSLVEWIKTLEPHTLKRFQIEKTKFNSFKVIPRLLLGQYLEDQFRLLKIRAIDQGISTKFHLGIKVTDIIDQPTTNTVLIESDKQILSEFDFVVISTGHNWPINFEGVIPQYFDSPYPPSKLELGINYPVAIRGSSLTAIDAIRTLARSNGSFTKKDNEKVSYTASADRKNFKIVMHSRSGLLPAVRFHLEDSHLGKDSVLSNEDIHSTRSQNEGFLPLDYVFEKSFKESIKENDREFYERIKDMDIEEFVAAMMSLRERVSPFDLFKAEYVEAEKSIRRKKSIYWKEALAMLSFAMNYPAKYFSAEDMLRLQNILMPLISIVIAFVPQTSVEELLALHEAGVLNIIAVGDDSYVVPQTHGGVVYNYLDEAGSHQAVYYKMYVDCVGQPHLQEKDIPFKSLVKDKTVSSAKLKFRDRKTGLHEMTKDNKKIIKDAEGNYYMKVAGIAINDNFQVLDEYGSYNNRLFMMAVPYIGGHNPDYSGLDFCEAASGRIVETILNSSQ
ncbi:MAG: FAD/NAD(P)-binding protein [Ginsengibacter sp.]